MLRTILMLLGVAAVAARPAAAQDVTGWLSAIWQDAATAEPADVVWLLTQDDGRTRQLEIDESTLLAAGGYAKVNRARVRVSGVTLAGADESVGRLPPMRVTSLQPLQTTASLAMPPQSGSKPYVTILCRFADSTNITPFSKAHYDSLMIGTSYPGQDHYWRELSENRIDLVGSVVLGWYNLPNPTAYYFNNGNLASPKFSLLVSECTGVADDVVNFANFSGVNLQFNIHMPYSWGGSAYHSRDGVNRLLPTTWMADWADHFVYAHEIGHSFGLPHSSGPYGQVYDSKWDVMSGRSRKDPNINQWIGVHTIGFHKDMLGWIPSARKYVAAAGSTETITIERSGSPPAGNYQMAQIPLPTGEYYTVEARRFTGYDVGIPGEAIVLHKVGTQALVVDPDNDADPNDDGAMWLPGETFYDVAAGVSVGVVSASSSGWSVTISRGVQLTTLTVSVTGSGRVTSAPAAIDCPGTCSATASSSTSYTLTAAPATGAVFTGWGGACSGTGACSLTMSANQTVTASFLTQVAIASEHVRPGAVAQSAYRDSLVATGGNGTIAWAVTAGALPPGLTLGSSGVIQGTPTATGDYTFAATATSTGLSASRTFTLTVHPQLAITTESARAGVMGASYADTLTAAGGMGGYTWRLAAGTLPLGVALDPNSGVLSGETSKDGTYEFTVEVRSGGFTSTKAFTVVVTKPVLQVAKVMDQLLGSGSTLTNAEIRFLDLLGNRNGRLDVGDVRAWLVDTGQTSALVQEDGA